MVTSQRQKLFEFLILEGFQAGLSWRTILHKRKNFRKAFDNFDFNKVAKYDTRKINSLLKDSGIIRNKQKIEGAIANAKHFCKCEKNLGHLINTSGALLIGNQFKIISEH